jgi:carbon catabolite-derepressing protein kinase
MGEGTEIKDMFPASKLGEYTVIQEIAEGTFGKVKSVSCFYELRIRHTG